MKYKAYKLFLHALPRSLRSHGLMSFCKLTCVSFHTSIACLVFTLIQSANKVDLLSDLTKVRQPERKINRWTSRAPSVSGEPSFRLYLFSISYKVRYLHRGCRLWWSKLHISAEKLFIHCSPPLSICEVKLKLTFNSNRKTSCYFLTERLKIRRIE